MATTSCESQKGSFKDYFYKEKAVLRVLGISFADHESIFYRIYSFVLILLANFLYAALNVRELFVNDFDHVADMCMYIFGTVVGLLKTTTVLINSSKLKKILEKLEQRPYLPDLERGGIEEEKLISFALWIGNVQCWVYWGCVTLGLVISLIPALIKRISSSEHHDWELPFGLLTAFDTSYSPNFEIALFYQIFSVAWIALQFSTIDIIIGNVLAHITFQFKVLQHNLRTIVENRYNKMLQSGAIFIQRSPNKSTINGSVIPATCLQESIKEVVEYHVAIIRLAEEMETVFSVSLLLVFVFTLGMLCFAEFRVMLMPVTDPRMFRKVIELLIACLQVATICFWGNEMMFESQQVAQSTFDANFVGADLGFQKALMLIAKRSRKPTKITAGKFADISLDTFTWIFRTSYSAFMVLNNNAVKGEEVGK